MRKSIDDKAYSLQKPHVYLERALKRKQVASPRYSRRALARDLGVSAAFVTKVLTGQRPIPNERLKKVVRLLEMDINEKEILLQSIAYHSVESADVKAVMKKGGLQADQSAVNRYNRVDRTKNPLLSRWYHVAILDLITCSDFVNDVTQIAARLGIGEYETTMGIKELLRHGLIEEIDGTYQKVERDVLFPTSKSAADVRAFHKEMIKKAYDQLSLTSESDFERRLITGFTIAANPENLERVKKLIFETLSEGSQQLSEGDCTEVYQFNIQLFPLTKNVEPK